MFHSCLHCIWPLPLPFICFSIKPLAFSFNNSLASLTSVSHTPLSRVSSHNTIWCQKRDRSQRFRVLNHLWRTLRLLTLVSRHSLALQIILPLRIPVRGHLPSWLKLLRSNFRNLSMPSERAASLTEKRTVLKGSTPLVESAILFAQRPHPLQGPTALVESAIVFAQRPHLQMVDQPLCPSLPISQLSAVTLSSCSPDTSWKDPTVGLSMSSARSRQLCLSGLPATALRATRYTWFAGYKRLS